MSAKRYRLVNRSSYPPGATMVSAIPAQRLCTCSRRSLHPSSRLRTKIKMRFRGVGYRSPHLPRLETSKVAHARSNWVSFHRAFSVAIIAIEASSSEELELHHGQRRRAGALMHNKMQTKGGSPMLRQ